MTIENPLDNAPLCPTCHSKISPTGKRKQGQDGLDSNGNPVPAWSGDPILTSPSLNGPNYTGQQFIDINTIKEIQDSRRAIESDLGIQPRTEFTSAEQGITILQATHITELRISTERILSASSISLKDYFSLDANGITQPPGPNDITDKIEWTDVARGINFNSNGLNKDILKNNNTNFLLAGTNDIPANKKSTPTLLAGQTFIKGIHVEDLRHPLPAAWIELFSSAIPFELDATSSINTHNCNYEGRNDVATSYHYFPGNTAIENNNKILIASDILPSNNPYTLNNYTLGQQATYTWDYLPGNTLPPVLPPGGVYVFYDRSLYDPPEGDSGFWYHVYPQHDAPIDFDHVTWWEWYWDDILAINTLTNIYHENPFEPTHPNPPVFYCSPSIQTGIPSHINIKVVPNTIANGRSRRKLIFEGESHFMNSHVSDYGIAGIKNILNPPTGETQYKKLPRPLRREMEIEYFISFSYNNINNLQMYDVQQNVINPTIQFKLRAVFYPVLNTSGPIITVPYNFALSPFSHVSPNLFNPRHIEMAVYDQFSQNFIPIIFTTITDPNDIFFNKQYIKQSLSSLFDANPGLDQTALYHPPRVELEIFSAPFPPQPYAIQAPAFGFSEKFIFELDGWRIK